MNESPAQRLGMEKVKVEEGVKLQETPATSSSSVQGTCNKGGCGGEGTLEVQIMALNDTKAGMEGIDVKRINHIIQETSRGSKFYLHKKARQELLDIKVNEMKAHLATLVKNDADLLRRTQNKVDLISQALEDQRDLSRVIVHLDMDAFYAAVEMRDDPSLRDVPMAVGGSAMLCTSNYAARKFGVRAAMPGFVAKKLCPHLVIVPCNFPKYTKASREVEQVLVEYGGDTLSMSMDEAYFDITDYLANQNAFTSEGSQITGEQVVQEIREKVFQKTKLTASAGIAANGLLAKICGDIRKPNNQYFLEPTVKAIKDFMKALPIRKVCGIGAVTEQMLKGLNIHNCGDLWENRGIIQLLFKPATASFLLAVSLGLGNSFFSRDSATSEERKSVSCERTFKGTSDKNELKEMCHEICTELQEDLIRKGVTGKTITLKIKTVDFEVKTRARSIPHYTSSGAKIFDSAWAIYLSYEKEFDGLKLRLMGVRISNLHFKTDELDQHPSENKQKTIHQMFAKMQDKSSSFMKVTRCPLCGQNLDSARDLNSHMDLCLISNEQEGSDFPEGATVGEELNRLDSETEEDAFIGACQSVPGDLTAQNSSVARIRVSCPVCNVEFEFNSEPEVERKMNSHVDECLNKATVRELVGESNRPCSSKRPHPDTFNSLGPTKKKKTRVGPIDSYFKSNS